MRGLLKLTWLEIRIFVREPLGFVAAIGIPLVMFLVLDSRAYRERLLLDERPRIRSWHVQLADLIATVMQEHGHATPRAIVLAQRRAAGTPWAWLRARWASRPRDTLPRPSPPAPGDGGPAEGGARPT